MNQFSLPHQFIVYDFETIPDEDLILSVYGQRYYQNKKPQSIEQLIELEKERKSSDDIFFKPPFQKVVSTGILHMIIDDDGNLRSNLKSTDPAKSEEHHLGAFWYLFGRSTQNVKPNKFPMLITFNGKQFDFPTLILRSMQYNFGVDWQEKDLIHIKKGISEYFIDYDKWENARPNYNAPFSKYNYDLSQKIGSPVGGLSTICKLNNISIKESGSGSEVWDYYKEQDFSRIQTYVEEDTIATTRLLFSYWKMISGYDPQICEQLDDMTMELDRLSS